MVVLKGAAVSYDRGMLVVSNLPLAEQRTTLARRPYGAAQPLVPALPGPAQMQPPSSGARTAGPPRS